MSPANLLHAAIKKSSSIRGGLKGGSSIRVFVAGLRDSNLHGNALFLMIAQGIMMVFGYVFWIIIARFYNTREVGIASTLISVAALISQISILGLNNALVRFLPNATDKNAKINTGLWLVTIGSTAIALGYLVGLPIFSPKLLFLRQEPMFLFLFISSMVLVTINTFTDSVFLANRATKYNVIIYAGYSIIRLVTPLLLVSMGALGIFISHISGIIVAVILSLFFMWRKFGWKPSFRISKDAIKTMGKYSTANYIAGFLWGLPLLVAPILVVNKLGASAEAYYYMVMMIVNVLQIIPIATTQSLFAEGSHLNDEPGALQKLVLRSMRFTLSLASASVLIAIIGGRFAISVFGKDYASHGTDLLYWLSVATIVMALNMTANTILKIRKQLSLLIAMNAVGAVATFSAYWIFIPRGLAGAGIGFLVGQLILATSYALLFAARGVPTLRRILLKPAPLS